MRPPPDDERDLLRALFEEAPVFLTLVEGPDLRIAMVNRCVRAQPGGAELVGKRARDIYPGDNPVLTTLERVYTTGVPETIRDHPPYYPDGRHNDRYFTRSFVPLKDERGAVTHVMTLVYEVTEEVRARETHEERQAELQRLYAVLEDAPILINVLEGPELRIVMSNRRTRELLGDRDVLGVSFADLVPPTNQTLQATSRAYTTGAPTYFEVVAQDVPGFVGRSFSTTVVPIRDEAGRVTHVMTASIETTEQRIARETLEGQARDLENARREAVDANRAKDEFLAMLGHELRNPLAPMYTTIELMRLRGTSGPKDLDVLERQVRHLTRMVDDLLDVSRVARGKIELKRRGVELTSVVHRALEMTSPLLERHRHRVISDLVPLGVNADPDRLAQVVANLLTNAAKFSDAGSRIRIYTERVGDRAKLTVADEGIGIDPEMIDRLFEPFVQQPQRIARSQGGLGLGLAIVKSLVEAHGGTVSVTSDGRGKGSTFVVELPIVENQSSRPPPPRDHLPLLPFTPPRRILVVDDNHDAAASLRDALRALGHTVAIAHDGPSGLATAAKLQPNIGLLDIGLPGMDGYELALALRAAHDIGLVAISGYGQDRDRETSREAGFDGHLVKPVELEQLAKVLHALHVRKRAE